MSVTQNIDKLAGQIYAMSTLSYIDRQRSLRWLSRQNDLLILEIFKAQKNHFHRIKSEFSEQDLVVVTIASLFISIKEVIETTTATNRKNRSSSFSFLKKVGQIRAKQHQKPRQKIKQQKLLNLQSVITGLIENEKYSFRDISSYLLKYHRFEVSHTSVRKFYVSLKKEKNG
jgi:hypothetical protein